MAKVKCGEVRLDLLCIYRRVSLSWRECGQCYGNL